MNRRVNVRGVLIVYKDIYNPSGKSLIKATHYIPINYPDVGQRIQ